MIVKFMLLATATIGPGLWQVRALAHGASDAVVTVHCIQRLPDWMKPIVPRGLVAGCSRADWNGPGLATCTPSGGLSVTGTGLPNRFDLVVRRYGRIAANPRAMAVFYIEGRRISSDCRF